jgi:hypothetical protein
MRYFEVRACAFLEIKNIEERIFSSAPASMSIVAITSAIVKSIIVVIVIQSTRSGRLARAHALDEFVEFSTIEPHAPTLCAIIYLDTATLRNRKSRFAYWAIHGF